ncbi:MAG: response regulator [Deltaproteobacteria bacterium]|nr:response regulator [Deltaproteobacteria bacterium]
MQPNRGGPDDRPLEGRTVLVAEDEARLRTIIVMMLEELGASVIAVSDCETAVAEYKSHLPGIDIVILDLRLKGVSGVQAYKGLLAIDPGAKVVISSGVTPDEDVLESLRQHGGCFIEKPFNLMKLGDALVSVLEGRAAPTY